MSKGKSAPPPPAHARSAKPVLAQPALGASAKSAAARPLAARGAAAGAAAAPAAVAAAAARDRDLERITKACAPSMPPPPKGK